MVGSSLTVSSASQHQLAGWHGVSGCTWHVLGSMHRSHRPQHVPLPFALHAEHTAALTSTFAQRHCKLWLAPGWQPAKAACRVSQLPLLGIILLPWSGLCLHPIHYCLAGFCLGSM